jgi:hypothetical protein
MTVVFNVVPLGGEHCDFCGSPSIFKMYECSNFDCCGRPVFGAADNGSWACCRTCSDFVEGKQWDLLTQRALYKFLARHEVPRKEIPTLWAQFAELHRSFAQHYAY